MSKTKKMLLLACIVALTGCPKAPPAPPAPTVPSDVLKAPNPQIEAAMKLYTNENDLIVAFQIVDVDFPRNTRKIKWIYSDLLHLSAAINNYEANKIGDTRWFTGESENDTNQISVINGNYNCVPIEKTRIHTIIANIADFVKHVCVIGIPPEYGKFSGYMAVWLKREPTPDELPKLITRMREFSTALAAAQ